MLGTHRLLPSHVMLLVLRTIKMWCSGSHACGVVLPQIKCRKSQRHSVSADNCVNLWLCRFTTRVSMTCWPLHMSDWASPLH